jgi:hypothetical protein
MALTDNLIPSEIAAVRSPIRPHPSQAPVASIHDKRTPLAGDPVRSHMFLTAAYLAGNSVEHHPRIPKDI